MANYQVYFTLDGTTWNGGAGDPVAGTGGIDLTAIEGDLVYVIAQGKDFSQTFNFGDSAFAYGSAVAALTAVGYTAGWPASGGGFTTFDPAKNQGSTLSNGNLTVTHGFYGGCQSVDGYNSGQYYFEMTNGHGHFDESNEGGGIARNFMDGGVFAFWANVGPFGSFTMTDPNGGALSAAGGLGNPTVSLWALGAEIASGLTPQYAQNSVIGVAVFLTSSGPAPPVIPAQSVPNSLERWRGQVGLNWLGMALVGDAFSNVVGLSDFENFTEYGNTMRFLVTTPPVQDDRKRIFVPRLEIEVECGEGLPNNPTVGAQMMMDWSKDGGKTWSTLQLWRSMGAAGDYTQRLRWLNMGQARQWIFRLSCTDVVRRYIIGAYIDDYRGRG